MIITPTLFVPADGADRRVSEHWYEVKDCDPRAFAIFKRHYSCRPIRANANDSKYLSFAGVGETLVLLTGEADALFVWRLESFRADGQAGVNCAIFRNERSPSVGGLLSSDLIRDAVAAARQYWPKECRFFTFVNPRRIRDARTANHGFCFLKAGWVRLKEQTKSKRLRILTYEVPG